MRSATMFIALFAGSCLSFAACHDDDRDGPANEYAGQPCEGPDECYPEADTDEILGDIECLSDWVDGGYCTHTCDSDDDCCAVVGECLSDLAQVCAPLESAPEMYCFVTCEDVLDEGSFCETYVHPDFHCRSTGGGTENRKVCLPN